MKSLLVFLLVIAVIIVIVVLLFGKASVTLSELQVQACATADKAGTCTSRLPEVGIVLAEECCSQLRKCCS